MAERLNVLIPFATAILGAILGTFLRPVVEEWFAKRRKTLHVEVLDNTSEFVPPLENMSINWHGNTVTKIIQTGFRIQNRTGRTLRNFRLEIGAKKPVGPNHLFHIYLEQNSRVRYGEIRQEEYYVYEFEFLEAGASTSGSMVSTYSRDVEFAVHGELELVRGGPKKYGLLLSFFWGFLFSFIVTSALLMVG